MKFHSWLLFVVIITGLVVFGWNCTGEGSPYANTPPITRLSNIPPTDQIITTKNPRLSLAWVGDDPDGYIVAFKYRWSYTITTGGVTQTFYKPWSTVVNIVVSNFTLMIDTVWQNSELVTPDVYRYFATLPPEGMPKVQSDALARGDTILVNGVRVYASNPDSITDNVTGLKIQKRFPTHVNPNSGTFIFDSQDSLNFHKFQVQSIDNMGATSSSAEVSFITPQVPPPSTEIIESPSDTVFVLDHKTDTFTGLRFSFRGYDPNSRTLEYQWVVDKDRYPADQVPWSKFSEQTFVNITASDFYNKYEGVHTFHVRARNEFGSIDTLGYFQKDETTTVFANRTFFTVYPQFARPGYTRKIMVVNNCHQFSDSSVNPAYPSYATIESYYSQMLNNLGLNGKYIFWRTKTAGFPNFSTLGQYSTILFVADLATSIGRWDDLADNAEKANLPLLSSNSAKYVAYLRVGGKTIISATGFANRINVGESFFSDAIRAATFLSPSPTSAPNCVGMNAEVGTGYFSVTPQASKLDTAWHGALPFLGTVLPVSFGERIYRYDDKFNSQFENGILGVRYLGVTFSTIYLGFPLYYIPQTDAQNILRKSLQDIGEF